MATVENHVYRIDRLHRVVDGDTLWCYVDLGFRQLALVELRLNGIDCPELHRGSAFERARGEAARGTTASYLGDDQGWIRTEPDPEKYGRWLATVWVDGRPSLQDTLLAAQLAVRSDGSQKWRTTYDKSAAG